MLAAIALIAIMTYSGDELREATNNFNSDNCLGKGGFGEVYQACIRHSNVAVKILKEVP